MFLVLPVSLGLYAQNSVETPTISIECVNKMTGCENQKIKNADTTTIGKLDNSNQLLVGLSIPKDSLSMAVDKKDHVSNCDDKSYIAGSFSVLAKDIIENYRYDFSETFIDILFFERIDLARTRTI